MASTVSLKPVSITFDGGEAWLSMAIQVSGLASLRIAWGDGAVDRIPVIAGGTLLVSHRYAEADGVLDLYRGTVTGETPAGGATYAAFNAVFNPAGTARRSRIRMPGRSPGWPTRWCMAR